MKAVRDVSAVEGGLGVGVGRVGVGRWSVRDIHAGRLSIVGRALEDGFVRRGAAVAGGGDAGVELPAAGGLRRRGKVVLSWRARKVQEWQSIRPWTASRKGQPMMVRTETSLPRAMERWTGDPSGNSYGSA